MSRRPEVILVDEDAVVRRAIQLLLRGHGYRVRAYPDVVDLMCDTEARHAALLLADESLPRLGRIGLLRMLRSEGWTGTALLMTRQDSDETVQLALAEGFQAMLPKPLRPSLLLREAAAARDRAAAG